MTRSIKVIWFRKNRNIFANGAGQPITDLPVRQIGLIPLGNFSSIVIPGYARYARLQDLTSVQGATCPPLMAARK
jgi:hypothetical protein